MTFDLILTSFKQLIATLLNCHNISVGKKLVKTLFVWKFSFNLIDFSADMTASFMRDYNIKIYLSARKAQEAKDLLERVVIKTLIFSPEKNPSWLLFRPSV